MHGLRFVKQGEKAHVLNSVPCVQCMTFISITLSMVNLCIAAVYMIHAIQQGNQAITHLPPVNGSFTCRHALKWAVNTAIRHQYVIACYLLILQST